MSDPHLGAAQKLDDDKDQIQDQADLETTERVFLRTLKTLGSFVSEKGRPSACVISGDITVQGRKSGFDRFISMLGEFEDLLPAERSAVIVVPGNHDVAWDAPPGSKERYAGFLRATRDQGCTTPLLDGVDFDPEKGTLNQDLQASHHLQTDELLLVPLNSSNYCGVITAPRGAMSEEEWAAALAPLPSADERERLLRDVRRSRQVDMARVSRAQIEALGEYFGKCRLDRDGTSDSRLRVAVFHHQLLPVSAREERKPYESLINLGLVRETLRDYGFQLLLHGHKHHGGVYWDALSLAQGDLSAQLRQILVISSPGHFNVNEPVMRAIELLESSSARNLALSTFAGASAQRKNAKVLSKEAVPIWSAVGEAQVKDQPAIIAPNAHVAYSRLRAMFALRRGEAHSNLMCQVQSATDAPVLPPDYPIGLADGQAWFTELVSWWQKDRPALVARGLVPFNHGERIRHRWGDQIERAVLMLKAREGSSRALVALVAPRETGRYQRDARDLDVGSFPAFTLAEFAVRVEGESRFLDCFGYFRKQEMQFWWPVNLAELALLQKQVRNRLGSGFKLGRVTTFSAIALWKGTLPGVAVPVIDRFIETPGRLVQMALTVAFPDSASPEDRQDWHRVLADLAGGEHADPPLAAAGVGELRAHILRLSGPSQEVGLGKIESALEDLADQYGAQAGKGELSPSAIKLIRRSVEAVREAVVAVIGEHQQ